MPGSYPDPRAHVNAALLALEEAYEESYDSHTGSLILTAIQAITRLRDEGRSAHNLVISGLDPYELNEHNSAV